MTVQNTFIIALRAIITNKVRSFLTVLGVIIGVFSVTMLTAIGNGLQAYVTEQFESLGSSNIFIYPGDIFGEDGGFNRESQTASFSNSKLKMSDVNDIEGLREFILFAVPINTASDKASYRDETKTVSVVGTTYRYQDIMKSVTEKDSFFGKNDDLSSKRVAVLGYEIANKLFGESDPVGKRIKIGNQTFVVAGVADKQGSGFGGPSFDTYVFIPFSTFSNIYDKNTIMEIMAKAKNKDVMPEAIKAIEDLLSQRLEDKEFSVFDQSEILDTINQILGAFTVGLGGIAAISLLVGGIGIMNIMLVSVTERTREIGLRKALGATPNQILLQFLIEAAFLSILGGLIGLGLAFLGSALIQPYFPAKVTMTAVGLAFGVSTVVGLVFGAAPARRASKLSPIEALRYE
ncbi:MAG: ABC transporter permease [Patescibacteria group bacterium]